MIPHRWPWCVAMLVAACDADPAPGTTPLRDAAADQPVEGGADDAPTTPDATLDATPDATLDATPDATLDATPDVLLDAAPDVASPDVALGNPLDGVGSVTRLRGGFMFTEGPQWRAREGDLVFSDIPANTIFRMTTAGMFSTFRQPSDNSNGLAVDAMGRLYAAEHGSRSVTRTRPDGSRETLASHVVEGGARRRLNSPNDLIVRADGTVYFTDPPYGITAAQQELSFNGVYRITPAGELTVEWRGARTSRPNGVALSPDARTLYVADTADGNVRAWDVAADGSLANVRVHATTSGNPDGMAVDRAGNLFVTTRAGVESFSPTGRRWGVIAFPEQPANCAFGGDDGRTLFVTARTGLYRVQLTQPGLY
jgi:gluconolactonase